MRTIITLVLLCLAPSVQAEFRHFTDWTTKEKGLFLAYNTVSYVDYKQTAWALDHPCNCYEEANPLFGNDPSKAKLRNVQFLISGSMYYMIGKHNPDAFNTTILGVTVTRSLVVWHNGQVGVSWKVAL